jgi:hypothetical protein
MVGDSTGLCPMAGFGINGVGCSHFATTVFVELKTRTSKNSEDMLLTQLSHSCNLHCKSTC